MAESVTATSLSSTAGKDPGIDDMLAHLELREDELDDVVIAIDEVKEFQMDARWLAIGKVHTRRSFSAEALFGKMKAIWNLSRDPICREAGENLFIFQMHCLGDWKKVVHQGPWTFRGWALLIEDYDGKVDPEKITFSGLHIWAQIHGIPELYRRPVVIDDLARRVGKVKEVQMSPKLFFEGNYVRLCVMIDVRKPLMRFVSLAVEDEGRKRLAVKYEKIPFFCKRCGLLGHNHEECEDGAWEPKDQQYGDWMLAVRRNHAQTVEPRRFVPREPTRGGFGGRGGVNQSAKKRSSQDAALDNVEELKDSATSPEKPAPMDEDKGLKDSENSNARKQLEMQTSEEENTNTSSPGAGAGIEQGTPPPPPGYVNPRDRSKQRKTDTHDNDLATSAASLEEDRWAQ
ncbi:hypothetical protein ACQ4PT_070420 [Festuca glaucescens]